MKGSDTDGTDDEEVDDDGVDSPSKFHRVGSKAGAQRRRLTELEWATFGAAQAGLDAELLNVNEHAGEAAASGVQFFSNLQNAGISAEQLQTVSDALFGSSSGPMANPPPQASRARTAPPPAPSTCQFDNELNDSSLPNHMGAKSRWIIRGFHDPDIALWNRAVPTPASADALL